MTILFVIQTVYASSVTITKLGILPGGLESQANSINNNGQIVGWSDNNASSYDAFLWQNGVMTDLGTLGGAYSQACSINDKGQIVGDSTNASGYDHACYWENGTSVPTDLGTLPGGSGASATGINNNGQIVGWSTNASGSYHVFLWHNGVMTDLGTLGGSYSQASSINDKGQIVGYGRDASGYDHAFLWQNGVMTDLRTLGGSDASAAGINNNGQIVGWSTNASGDWHACYWENGTSVPIDLGQIPGGKWGSSACGINDKGQIVGFSSYPGCEHYEAVLWTINNVTSASPIANFTSNVTSGNAPLTVTFKDKSTGSPTSWKWNFGDGTSKTSQNPTHTYSTAGNYTVKLTVTNSAGNNTTTKTNYIKVTGKPVVNFTSNVTSGNVPLTVTFKDKSTGSPTSWKWSFGDGSTKTSQNPTHTYSTAGNYTVALTVTNAAGNNTTTKTNYIKVIGKPVASFSAKPTSGTKPLTVTFKDTSTGSPTSWRWSFGDGSVKTSQNPAHTYSKAGSYTVKLTVANVAGSITTTKTNYIVVK